MTTIRTFARAATTAIAAATLALGGVAAAAAPATALESDEAPHFEFDMNPDGTATITSCPWGNCSYGAIDIPATISDNGVDYYDVTAIADDAFDTFFLSAVTLPEGLTSIGANAFAGNGLSEIALPSTLEHVGTHAFYRSSLGDITIPAALTDVDEDAFYYAGITSITWEGSPTTISHGAFSYNDLTSVTIPASVTSISDAAFSGNSDLASVILPPHLERIEPRAFSDNQSLTDVTYPGAIPTAPQFPPALTSIGSYAFSDAALTELTLPNGLTHLGEAAFSDNALTSLALPESLTTIPMDAFAWNNLQLFAVPESVTVLGSGAFHQNPLMMVAFLGDEPAMGQDSLGWHGGQGATPPTVVYDLANTGFGYPTWTAYGIEFPTAPGTTVEFVTDHGITPEPQSVAYGALVPDPGALEADWHTFLGWFTQPEGGEKWDFANDTIASAQTLYAQWEAVTHPVTFVFGPHAADAVVAVAHGSPVSAPVAPFLAGHRFAGWTIAGEPADLDAAVTGALTVTAVYAASAYTIDTPGEAAPGDEIAVSGTGFDPDETVTLELHSTPIALGATMADASGAFSTTITLPSDAPAGDHQIVATGAAGQASSPVTLTAVPEPAPSDGDDADLTPTPAPERPGEPGPATDSEGGSDAPGDEGGSSRPADVLTSTGPANTAAVLALGLAITLAGAAVIGSVRVSRGTVPRSR